METAIIIVLMVALIGLMLMLIGFLGEIFGFVKVEVFGWGIGGILFIACVFAGIILILIDLGSNL